MLSIRPARTSDVPFIREVIDTYSPDGRLLSKATVTLYEDIQEFLVGEIEGEVVACGALHVMWSDLGEIRTLAVLPKALGGGVGSALLEELMKRAKEIGLSRLFCLTFETDFFGRHGFVEISEAPVDQLTFAALLQSEDEGVAEFLDLERVKPNTLGNTRMIKHLSTNH